MAFPGPPGAPRTGLPLRNDPLGPLLLPADGPRLLPPRVPGAASEGLAGEPGDFKALVEAAFIKGDPLPALLPALFFSRASFIAATRLFHSSEALIAHKQKRKKSQDDKWGKLSLKYHDILLLLSAMPKRSRSPVAEDVPMLDHVPLDDDVSTRYWWTLLGIYMRHRWTRKSN